jgi:hypothetical protein
MKKGARGVEDGNGLLRLCLVVREAILGSCGEEIGELRESGRERRVLELLLVLRRLGLRKGGGERGGTRSSGKEEGGGLSVREGVMLGRMTEILSPGPCFQQLTGRRMTAYDFYGR